MKRSTLSKYFINFILTTIFLILMGILLDFTPFGSQSFLTIDLGQQYIDFYSLYKDTLLHNPAHFVYSFNKGFGGEMIGLWAYYLMSPFNLIFLFFNETNFHIAVALITYLKIVASSLTMMFFIDREYELSLPLMLVFSFSYAFMSYNMVYMLNIMWLDGIILLPIIAVGLTKIIKVRQPLLYVLSLTMLFVVNYYIGFMISIFLVFYAGFVISIQPQNPLKKKLTDYLVFVKYSFISAISAGFMLYPTLNSILQSKGANVNFEFNFNSAHNLIDVLAKSFIGNFIYDEISGGSPNIYAGLFVFVAIGFYYLSTNISWKEKLVSLGIFSVLFLSYYFEVLDKIWHGGQFPIWYHFRFSFVHSFFSIVLAIRAIVYRPKKYPLTHLIGLLTIIVLFCLYYFTETHQYEFLTNWKIFLSFLFMMVYLLLFQLPSEKYYWHYPLIFGLVFIEVFTNGFLTLNEFNYVQSHKFEDYVLTLDQAVHDLKHGDNDFYRIHTTFMRTKNEAFYVHYDGLDHFGSTIEAHVPELYGYLGLPDGSGFIAYSNGTLFTDDFFNVKYLINPTEDTKMHTADSEYTLFQEAKDIDIQDYPIVDSTLRYEIHENKSRFGLGIEVDPSIISSSQAFKKNNPIYNQNYLLKLIDFQGEETDYFTKKDFNEISYHNLSYNELSDSEYFEYKVMDLAKDGFIRHHYDLTSDNPHYFTLPSQITSDNVTFKLNSEPYRIYTPFRHRQITNASYNEQKEIYLDMIIEETMKANLVKLYEFDLPRYKQLIKDKQPYRFNVTSFSPINIEGNIKTERKFSHILFTIPYDHQWHVTVDGHPVKTYPVLNNTLMSIPIERGNHTIKLNYKPISLYIGIGISVLGISLFIFDRYYSHKYDKIRDSDFKKVSY